MPILVIIICQNAQLYRDTGANPASAPVASGWLHLCIAVSPLLCPVLVF